MVEIVIILLFLINDLLLQSSVRYDKFESLSLALPAGAGDLGWGRHKLHQLLTNFVTPEVVMDVQCEGCNKGRDPLLSPILAKQVKILNFGKVHEFKIRFVLYNLRISIGF